MLNLAAANLPVLAVALLIGVATARWAFAKRAPAPQIEDEPRP